MHIIRCEACTFLRRENKAKYVVIRMMDEIKIGLSMHKTEISAYANAL